MQHISLRVGKLPVVAKLVSYFCSIDATNILWDIRSLLQLLFGFLGLLLLNVLFFLCNLFEFLERWNLFWLRDFEVDLLLVIEV
jgi:hypothetical protein